MELTMKLSKEQLSRIYRDRTAPSAPGRRECIAEEAMVRAAAGEMTRPERERLADHLSACSECTREYQTIRSLRTWSHRAGGEEPETEQPESTRRGLILMRRTAPILWAVAASLMIAAVGLSFWIIPLRRESQRLAATLAARDRAIAESRRQLSEEAGQIAQLRREVSIFSQPQLNAPILDLDPKGSVRGLSAQDPQTLRVPATANVFTLVLNTSGQRAFPDYSLVILDGTGKVIWAGGGLHKSPSNTFTVALPSRLAPAGLYRIKLYGLRSNRKELLEDYRIGIRYQ
jgi:hypothetical protein